MPPNLINFLLTLQQSYTDAGIKKERQERSNIIGSIIMSPGKEVPSHLNMAFDFFFSLSL